MDTGDEGPVPSSTQSCRPPGTARDWTWDLWKANYLGVVFYLFIYFLAVLGLRCCLGLSLVVASECYILVVLPRLLTAVASFVGAHGLQSLRTSVTVASRAQA